LLCDFAEMLLWLHAPDAALAMQARQLADPTLRSVTVQRATLGVSLAEIQHALMEAWRLPELLVRITDERHQEATQVRNVLLAIRVARHTAKGWTNPAIPDDIRDVARLLNLDEAHAEILLKDVDG
jgi:HD-like signal output (HDOD) protein